MGRIWASVTITNILDPDRSIRCEALVDTGASHMVLPSAWRERLGDLREVRTARVRTATQEPVGGAISGPVRIQIEGFRPICTEVAFIDMKPDDGGDGKAGKYVPLIGSIVLDQSQAAVDMIGDRLVDAGPLYLKWNAPAAPVTEAVAGSEIG